MHLRTKPKNNKKAPTVKAGAFLDFRLAMRGLSEILISFLP